MGLGAEEGVLEVETGVDAVLLATEALAEGEEAGDAEYPPTKFPPAVVEPSETTCTSFTTTVAPDVLVTLTSTLVEPVPLEISKKL